MFSPGDASLAAVVEEGHGGVDGDSDVDAATLLKLPRLHHHVLSHLVRVKLQKLQVMQQQRAHQQLV